MGKRTTKKFMCMIGLTAIALGAGSCDNNNKTSTSFVFTGTTTATTTDGRLQLKMYGDLYYGGMRSIYVLFSEGLSGEIEWKSSNEDIVAVTLREGLTNEAFLVARDYGVVTITATLKDNPSIKATYDVLVSNEGENMPESLFNQIRGGVKMTSSDNLLSFNENYEETIEESYTITTIYEETNPEEIEDNLTEAYQITVIDDKTGKVDYETKFVRGTGKNVATESINIANEVVSNSYLTEDEETIKWGSSYYQNIWNCSSIVTNEMFKTFDEGKTYHYVGDYTNTSELCRSMYLTYMSPDDMYFEVNNDNLKLHITIDPYNEDVDATTKYGRRVTTSFSEIGTAVIDHLKPYTHETYHDKVESALDKMANAKNYVAKCTLDYPGTNDDVVYEFTFTEDTIDQIVKNKDGIVSRTGAHKVSDEKYFQYKYDYSNKKVIVTNPVKKNWEEVGMYPTFGFSAEIFKEIETNKYESKLNTGIFLAYCAYLNNAVSYYDFNYPGTITLNDEGYIQEVSAKLDAFDEALTITVEYSSFGDAKCDLDFTSIGEENLPSSFKEANKELYEEMVQYGIEDVVPYLYSEVGYAGYVGWERKRNETGETTSEIESVYFGTNYFNDEEVDAFIEAYKAKLIAAGYVETSEKYKLNYFKEEYNLYQKGDYKITVAKDINTSSGRPTGKVIIIIKSDLLESPDLSYN